METQIIKVKANASLNALASSIVHFIDEGKAVIELRAIGAGAVNQMYKACAKARGELASRGKDLFIKPGFKTVENVEGEERTAMIAVLVVK